MSMGKTLGTPDLIYQQYMSIYARVNMLISELRAELTPEDIYMLKRVQQGALKEALSNNGDQ